MKTCEEGIRCRWFRLLGVLLTVAKASAGVVAISVATAEVSRGSDLADEASGRRTTGAEAERLPSAERLSDMFRSAARKVLPCVVQIKNAHVGPFPRNVHNEWPHVGAIRPEESFEENEFAVDEEALEQGLGCGIIIDPSGIVVTNCHVVEGAGEMLVELADGRLFKVKDIRTDERTDLAVLQLDSTTPLPAAMLGDSDSLRIGDWVLTIGSPFALEQTVSAGIVSATERLVRGTGQTRLLQTDAAINPGSSGGALVNVRGEVVGVTTAIASRDGGYQGVGFAVPINLAKRVSVELRENGHVRRGYLGISTTARTVNLTGDVRGLKREIVAARVDRDSPAYKAGVRENDVVVSFDNRPIRGASELRGIVEQLEVGSKHLLVTSRGGTPTTLEVTIGQASSGPKSLPSALSAADGTSELVYSRDLELAASDLTMSSARQLGLKSVTGALVRHLEPNGAASKAGVREGMAIVRVGDRIIRDTNDFAEAMESQSLVDGIWLQVFSRQGARTILVRSP